MGQASTQRADQSLSNRDLTEKSAAARGNSPIKRGIKAFAFGGLVAFVALSPRAARPNAPQTESVFSTPEQLEEDIRAVPCKNKERLERARALFEKMGASAADILVQDYKDVQDLIVRWPGPSQDKIVVGAHYDKVEDGCGAIDNWTGIVAVAHLYRTSRKIAFKKTLLFVAFGKEEQGLIGSHAMANAIAKDQLAEYCAMVNIDSLGLGAPQVMENTSSAKLQSLAKEMADRLKLPFGAAVIRNADADSSSFIQRKIPALTMHGLTNEWPKLLHTSKDQVSRINPVSVYLGYRLALAVMGRIDGSECDAFR